MCAKDNQKRRSNSRVQVAERSQSDFSNRREGSTPIRPGDLELRFHKISNLDLDSLVAEKFSIYGSPSTSVKEATEVIRAAEAELGKVFGIHYNSGDQFILVGEECISTVRIARFMTLLAMNEVGALDV